jgi:hypothetical protein
VEGTGQPAVVDRRLATPGERTDVVDLEAKRGTADASGIGRELALSPVPRPDGPLHRGRHVAWVPRRTRVPLRLLHLGAALGLLRQQEVERGFQHLLRGSTGLRVPLTLPRGIQLLEELLRDCHVEAKKVGGERLERVPSFRRRDNRQRSPLREFGRRRFNRSNQFNRLNAPSRCP